jgi:riboflavin synthase alpha subunit
MSVQNAFWEKRNRRLERYKRRDRARKCVDSRGKHIAFNGVCVTKAEVKTQRYLHREGLPCSRRVADVYIG